MKIKSCNKLYGTLMFCNQGSLNSISSGGNGVSTETDEADNSVKLRR